MEDDRTESASQGGRDLSQLHYLIRGRRNPTGMSIGDAASIVMLYLNNHLFNFLFIFK